MSDIWIITILFIVGYFGLLIAYISNNRTLRKTIDNKNQRIIDLDNLSIRQSDRIGELEKKAKMSNDVLAVLNEVNGEGAILHVQRINKDDIFIHNGSQYR